MANKIQVPMFSPNFKKYIWFLKAKNILSCGVYNECRGNLYTCMSYAYMTTIT